MSKTMLTDAQLELNRVLALQPPDKPLRLFFRDDDVDEDEASLRRLLQFFAEAAVPLNLAIIPALLTAEAAGLLLASQAAHPGLFSLNQHGWQHRNHELMGRKCEFGVSRSYAEQLDDIARGQERMQEAFGDGWFPAFVPPWNRCTTDTHRVLCARKFRVFSALRSAKSEPVSGLRDISISLDLFRWQGGATLRSAAELYAEFSAQLRQAQADDVPVGIMLHHKVMQDDAYKFLTSLLHVLAAHRFIRIHTFEQLSELPEPPESC